MIRKIDPVVPLFATDSLIVRAAVLELRVKYRRRDRVFMKRPATPSRAHVSADYYVVKIIV